MLILGKSKKIYIAYKFSFQVCLATWNLNKNPKMNPKWYIQDCIPNYDNSLSY